jgi:hypothetical protein
MTKQFLFSAAAICITINLTAQIDVEKYPIPEYSNEINLLKKSDDSITLQRLEKGSAKKEMKVKMMGMGGMDNGYELEGEKSTVRLSSGSNLVFIYYTGAVGSTASNPVSDSLMKANGIDMSAMSNPMSMMEDPAKTITLYNTQSAKGNRKVMLQSMGLMGKSKKTSTVYTISVKKIKDSYYQMIVDKELPRGEYAFILMSGASMDGSYPVFAFAVE